jgi:hypothetical protein
MSGLSFLTSMPAASDAQWESIGATGDSRRSAPRAASFGSRCGCWERSQQPWALVDSLRAPDLPEELGMLAHSGGS